MIRWTWSATILWHVVITNELKNPNRPRRTCPKPLHFPPISRVVVKHVGFSLYCFFRKIVTLPSPWATGNVIHRTIRFFANVWLFLCELQTFSFLTPNSEDVRKYRFPYPIWYSIREKSFHLKGSVIKISSHFWCTVVILLS